MKQGPDDWKWITAGAIVLLLCFIIGGLGGRRK